ncbi:type I methionyl aminopeptidase [Agilicoccus flavus]|uniref:type I methionyl aminopeptidase n=1 Tax=Agilicoccus flavus TaxID=2775968 RepID=UPI001CF7046B|nr:type I methionyl aminopeptidase [Agilicoccus flavus]
MVSAAAPVVAGRVTPAAAVPARIPRPEYVGRPGPRAHTGSEVQTPETIDAMRTAGRIAAAALAAAGAAVAPGVTTDELDRVAHDHLVACGAYPSPLGYRGYPRSVCTSVNEVVCHGIPDDRPLADGDIVNVDVTCFVGGVHGDTNATFLVGDVDPESRRLVEATREALARGIRAVRPGRRLNVVGRVIETYARRHGLGVVRDYTGHGISTVFHSGLVVPHYDSPAHDTLLVEGMTFTIEPMLTLGAPDTREWSDGWTAVTVDGSRSAQFEHTIVVTADGAEILTAPPDPSP